MATENQDGTGNYATDLVFYVNGTRTQISAVSPATLLVDYLRSAEVGLTGTKIGCKQGGCGACTVLLSTWDAEAGQASHRSINSCLRPLASVDGMMVTTIEGMGSVNSVVSPVQYSLAKNNGTQCGYCTPGWVMTAHGCLSARGVDNLTFNTKTDRVDPSDPNFDRLPTKAELQDRFDGNLCRCTGYRPILHGFEKGFARDWEADDGKDCMTCQVDPAEDVSVSTLITPVFPDALKRPPRAVRYERDGYTWVRPLTLKELQALVGRCTNDADYRLVFGNTSIGVYDKYIEDPRLFIDLSHIAELRTTEVDETGMFVGSAVTYNDFLGILDGQIAQANELFPERLAGLEALHYMAGRTAGAIVRDAASLGGNTMLVLRHILSGVPFPSDLFTALGTVDASVSVWNFAKGTAEIHSLLAFAELFAESKDVRARCLLLGYHIPFTRSGTYVQTYKTALREVNAHSIVNAGFLVRLSGQTVTEATVVVGGIAPRAMALPSVQNALLNQPWEWTTLEAATAAMLADVDALTATYRDRFSHLAWEGFTDEYKRDLAASFLYKFFVLVALRVNPSIVSPETASASERPVRPVSHGTQHFRDYASTNHEAPIGVPFVKIEAFLQATGEAVYPQDLPLPHRGLEAAHSTSTRARGTFHYALPGSEEPHSPAEVLEHLRTRFPGVVDYLTEADLMFPDRGKHKNQNLQGEGKDQPVFASLTMEGSREYSVETFGQSLGLVLAESEQVARDAAQYLGTHLVTYTDATPIVTIQDALAAHSIFPDFPDGATWISHVWKVIRPNSVQDWADDPAPCGALSGVHCQFVRGTQQVGGQVHFYMETQTCLAVPGEEGQMLLRSSTQDSAQVQSAVANVLGVPQNKVDVRIKRIGGGYGGKCTNPTFVAVASAVAARKHNRAVRLAVQRDVDTAMFGQRHPAQGEFAVAIGDGSDGDKNRGTLVGLRNQFHLNGGWTYDCSMVVSDCLQLRADSAYYVRNYATSSDVCQTNTVSNTAFRTLGMIQGVLMQEEAIEAAAHRIGMLPEDVREKNLYRHGQKTPFGQVLEPCYMDRVFKTTREKYAFDKRLKAVEAFNASNRFRKRGISLIPVKYGSGFNLPMLEQAGALLEIFDADGTVLVRTGGVEMGQGLNTKIAQVAAYYLGIPVSLIRVAELDTSVVPHPTSTGASTGSSFNAEAVRACCEQLYTRLKDYCRIKALPFPSGPDRRWDSHNPEANTNWTKAVSAAHGDRINLSAQARAAIDGGEKIDDEGLFFHNPSPPPGLTNEVNYNFTGYTYSAAIAEVEVDVLTGETVILQADVVYDMGRSQNPAVDVGQIEGAFVQGIGYVMYEERIYQPKDTPLPPGVLNTTNTWTYKPPAVTSIPLKLNVDLFPNQDNDSDPLLSSKEVGEPPMTLAATVFFAIKHAILAARKDQGDDGWFDLEAPATVQRISSSCRVESRTSR